MSKNHFFENTYEDFTSKSATNILNDCNDGLSETFEEKLKNFNRTKLHILKSEMEHYIYHNHTVYTGSGGLALYYFLCAMRKGGNLDLLRNALECIDLDYLDGRRISFLCGDAGPLAMAIVISYKLGSRRPDTLPEYKTLVRRLMALASSLNASPDELLYGKTGYLYALLFVNKYIQDKEIIPASHIEMVIRSILKSGKRLSTEMESECPLMWEWHIKLYFGAAHGMAGILYMLLQARTYINATEMHNFIKPTIDWLLDQRFESGNFPSSMRSTSGDKLVQWCHGAPGFIPLCILAAQIFEEERYMNIATQACDVVWQRGLCTKGYSICHGVSGNAYAFIQMYQATKKPVYLYRACCFTEWCVLERPETQLHPPDKPGSLFEGLVGRVYLVEDMMNILEAKFPAYSL